MSLSIKKINKYSKGIILILWIFGLSAAAIYAVSNSVSSFVLENFGPRSKEPVTYNDDRIMVDPTLELNNFLAGYVSDPPPIESVIDSFIGNSEWSQIKLSNPDKTFEQALWERDRERENYRKLFDKSHKLLLEYVFYESSDLKSEKIMTSRVISSSFFYVSPLSGARENFLPPEAVNWIIVQREKENSKRDRKKIIDTFVLLMVLGAFGSLIFLTYDYITIEEKTPIEVYIFRPILGMFLAISMFIVIIATHEIVSKSDIFSFQAETLYFLAFAGGLMSEQAYKFIQNKSRGVLEKDDSGGSAG